MSEEMLLMRNNKSKISIFLAVLFMLFIVAGVPGTSISANETVGNKQEVKHEAKQQKNPYTNAEITIKIIPAAKKTFGYDIYMADL